MGAKTFIYRTRFAKARRRKSVEGNKIPKILVLDLERIEWSVQLFDELGIEVLEDHKVERPLWSLANIDASQFEGLPVEFSMTEKLLEIRKQMLGEKQLDFFRGPQEMSRRRCAPIRWKGSIGWSGSA